MNQDDTTPTLTDIAPDSDHLAAEDSIVAELERLDIRYLSRQSGDAGAPGRPPATLLADLMRQPSARVREAVIAVLLAHPAYAQAVPVALAQLSASEQVGPALFLQRFRVATATICRCAALLHRRAVAMVARLVFARIGSSHARHTTRTPGPIGRRASCVHPIRRSTGPAHMTMWRANSCGAGVWSTDGTSNP